MQLVISLAALSAGFSLFSALLLALTHVRAETYQGLARAMGLLLLAALAGLQLVHVAWLVHDLPWVDGAAYRVLLFLVAPAFFLFSRPLLQPDAPAACQPRLLLHGLPALVAVWLPSAPALPLAFAVGAFYLLWLGRTLYQLRGERAGFRREILLLGGVFLIAVLVSLFGLIQPVFPAKLFFCLYALAIGAAFFLVQLVLSLHPHLPDDVVEVVQAGYAHSTLGNLDCDVLLARLQGLMHDQRLFVDPELNLAGLAERLAISSHQLSELLNNRLGKGFSRYLRELRIEAAKQMLCDEPSASVLSIGLSVGFTSQSNFYEAFREIEGMPPGQYRKLNTRKP